MVLSDQRDMPEGCYKPIKLNTRSLNQRTTAQRFSTMTFIDVSTHAGLRDRPRIGLMVYFFARIGAALGMTVENVFTYHNFNRQ
jgi:hypothetical protein